MPKTVKKRGHIPEDKLRQVASSTGSLFYETLMLKETAARCVEPTDEGSLEIIVPYNMAIECFLIHFRNLREFLYPNAKVRRDSDNVIAFDYDSRWLKTENDWKECSDNERSRINKLLAHISYSRGELHPRWPTGRMRQCMMQRLAEFIVSLPPERQEWFEAWGLKKVMAAAESQA